MKLCVDSPSADVLDLISDEELVKVLRLRGPVPPDSLNPVAARAAVQVAREKRILRLLPKVSR